MKERPGTGGGEGLDIHKSPSKGNWPEGTGIQLNKYYLPTKVTTEKTLPTSICHMHIGGLE